MNVGKRVVLFAGGGTGGHIFPNLAIYQRLQTLPRSVDGHFVVSNRPIDTKICQAQQLAYSTIDALPLSLHPKRFLYFVKAYKKAVAQCRAIIQKTHAGALVASGGFVSGPAMKAAAAMGLPVALMNLDAVPGRANRWCARDATEVFTSYQCRGLPRAQLVGMPLRNEATEKLSAETARWELGLRPDLPTLLITAGSQGASTINQMMIELVGRTANRNLLDDWQVLHLTGQADREAVQQAYEQAGVLNKVEAFCHKMGWAWSAASLAISRAGASSVAEAWHHGVPTLFMPYPFHKDDHQRKNAEPLVTIGGAMMLKDHADAIDNVAEVAGPLKTLLHGEARRVKMREAALAEQPGDGADALARWVASVGG